MSAEVELNNILHHSRFPRHPLKCFVLLLYFPLGCVLALLRLFICLQVLLATVILPDLLKRVIVRQMFVVLGMVVKTGGAENVDKSCRLLVSNHISVFDHLCVKMIRECNSVTSVVLPELLLKAFSLLRIDKTKGEKPEEFLGSHLRSESDTTKPVLIHPEDSLTNGKGLLKFSSAYLTAASVVQPVALSVRRLPVTDVAVTCISSSWMSDVFWFLFVPVSWFTATMLPIMEKKTTETADEFGKRIQEAIAQHLNIVATKFTARDKAEYVKRFLHAPASRRVRPSFSQDVLRMAGNVKEVLPYVPLDVIARDIVRTRSVDLTISNLLDGSVIYSPESQSQTPQQSSATHSSSSESEPKPASLTRSLDTSAKTFFKSSSQRMLSYQERKARLIERARQIYIEKHGLDC